MHNTSGYIAVTAVADYIDEGHCQIFGCPTEAGWDRDLYRLHPELCTTERRKCPTCKKSLCKSCWDTHDISHFGKRAQAYGFQPSFYAAPDPEFDDEVPKSVYGYYPNEDEPEDALE